ncbi:MAG: NADH-quinone oxidoreductase subunit NuoE [Myxococcales bacterium]|nr:NADH-quinone oxidoreductase subunit NuoE [Myxococcota bacterium]MDW8282870.1 NADH-quinone oxidoreductase subunit NuoE [Myxococcales bacterium]
MPLSFSPEAQRKIAETRRQYPNAQAACLPVLHIAQDEFGYLSDEALELVAQTLNLPTAHVFGVATFYTMYHRKPVGRHVLMMCTNVSCMLRGAYDTLRCLEERLGIRAGQTTPDGEFTLVEEECLAACADAPAMVCGQRYFLHLTPDRVDEALQECRSLPPTHGRRRS